MHFRRLLGAAGAVAITVGVSLSTTAPASAQITPPYFSNPGCMYTMAPEYSPQLWSVTTGSSPVADYAIANWGSNSYNSGLGGPGKSKSSADATQITDAEKAGATIVGYIGTNYGTQGTGYTQADIEDQMNQWYDWYGVTNFFLDETPTATTYESLYGDLLSYAQQNISVGATTWLNMGDYPASSSWMSYGSEFGDWESGSAPTAPPSWMIHYQPILFFGVMNDTPDNSTDIAGGVSDVESAHAAIGFVTDDDTYQTFTSSYWDTFAADAGTPNVHCLS
jgi:Spherulation-specific family 4